MADHDDLDLRQIYDQMDESSMDRLLATGERMLTERADANDEGASSNDQERVTSG